MAPQQRFSRRAFVQGVTLGAVAAMGLVAPPALAAPGWRRQATAAESDVPNLIRAWDKPQVVDANWQPVKGGTVTVGQQTTTIDTLDPQLGTWWTHMPMAATVFEPLIWQGPDLKYYPGLAESWEVAPGGTEVRLRLRQGVKFHDGTPFDASAVKFNIERVQNPDTKAGPIAVAAARLIQSVEVVDAATARLRLAAPDSLLELHLSSPGLVMVSPAAVQKYGPDFGHNPVGTGAWIFKEWQERVAITLVPNPAYAWAPAFGKNQGPPFPDKLVIAQAQEKAARMAAALSGEVLALHDPDATALPTFLGDERFAVFGVGAPGCAYNLQMISVLPPLDDLQVRKALMYGVDRDAVKIRAVGEYVPRATSFLAPGTFGHDPALDATDMYPFDRDKARALLDAAGWAVGADGFRARNGQPLLLQFHADWDKVAEPFKLDVEANLGIKVDAQVLETGAWFQEVTSGKTHMAETGGNDPDGGAMLYLYFHSSNWGKTTGRAFSRLKIPGVDLDQELDAMMSEPDTRQREARIMKLERMVMEQAYGIPMTYQVTFWAVNTSKLGGNLFLSQRNAWYLNDVYLRG